MDMHCASLWHDAGGGATVGTADLRQTFSRGTVGLSSPFTWTRQQCEL